LTDAAPNAGASDGDWANVTQTASIAREAENLKLDLSQMTLPIAAKFPVAGAAVFCLALAEGSQAPCGACIAGHDLPLLIKVAQLERVSCYADRRRSRMGRSLGLALLFAAANSAWAQYVVSARAGTINFTTGQVLVDDRPAERRSTKFPTLKDGQLLRTNNSRAEILLGPGVFVRLGPHAALRMVNSRLEDTQIEIEQGAALVEVIEIANGDNLHVLLGGTSTTFRGIGLHRFDVDSGDLFVYGGHAEVSASGQTLQAARGHVIHLRELSGEGRFDPHEKDPLLQWAASRSFRLFISNPAARARLTNWEVTDASAGGYAVASDQNRSYYFNRDFGVTFISRVPGRSTPVRTMPPSFGDLYPRRDPAPRPPTANSPIPAVTYPGPASNGPFPN
jgi:hypothetical protein